MNNYLTPKEVLEYTEETGFQKAYMPLRKSSLLSFLAGLFIALASVASNVIAYGIENTGLAKYLAGLIFPAGLILVVVAGAELFTGNNLISVAVLSKRVSPLRYIKNLILIWSGNLAGSFFVALLVYLSGQFDMSGGLLGAYTIKVGVIKTNLSFIQLFTSGILCNILVCLAVWMAYAAKDVAGKSIAIFFPIWLFIASGYEHSVANMYYLSAALLAKLNPLYTALAQTNYDITINSLSNLTIYDMFITNLVPVTLGNLAGGAFFIGAWYWWAYKKQ
jgi:formate/nitrite transporter